MKIVHVNSMAGVSQILAKYLREYYNMDSMVCMNAKDAEGGINEFYSPPPSMYEGRIRHKGLYNMMYYRWLKRQCSDADIIHAHDPSYMMPMLRKWFPKKKVIWHHHGWASVIREYIRLPMQKLADYELIAINSMVDLEYACRHEFMPNPIDVEHFGSRPVKKNNKGRMILKVGQIEKNTRKWLAANGYDDIDWEFMRIEQAVNRTTYADLPSHLSDYEWVGDIDMRYGATCPLPLYNITGLQAMSVGCKTITHDGIHNILPAAHHPKKVVKRLYEIYRELLE